MRSRLLAAPALVLGVCLLGMAVLFALCWARSAWYTDDIACGERSWLWQVAGISRCKLQGGGLWLERRPAMVGDDRGHWDVFPASGQYCFAASSQSKLPERLGFLADTSNQTWVVPCWLAVLTSLAGGVTLLIAGYRGLPSTPAVDNQVCQ